MWSRPFFVNLLRGTGIRGLSGIKNKRGAVIRPLLFASKQEVYSYVKKEKISFREDASNKSLKYLRNNIRHNLVPVLSEIKPNASEKNCGEYGAFRGL